MEGEGPAPPCPLGGSVCLRLDLHGGKTIIKGDESEVSAFNSAIQVSLLWFLKTLISDVMLLPHFLFNFNVFFLIIYMVE